MFNYRLLTIFFITLAFSLIAPWSLYTNGNLTAKNDAISSASSPIAPYRRISQATGKIRFLTLNQPIGADNLALSQPNPVDLAWAYWETDGALFGIQNPPEELQLQAIKHDAIGMAHLTFEQFYKSIPVFGASLRMHMNAQGEIQTINGIFVPDIMLNVSPKLTASQATDRALQIIQERQPHTTLQLIENRLVIYRTNLVQDQPGLNYLAYAVEVGGREANQWTLFINAQNGKLIHLIDQQHTVLDRRIYNDEEIVWREGDAQPYKGSADATANAGINDLIDYTEDTYNFFYTLSGGTFDAWDSQGAAMTASYNGIASCPNA